MINEKSVNERIREIWKKSGLTQVALVERINAIAKEPGERISLAQVSKIMSGYSQNTTKTTLEKLAFAMGVSVADFYSSDIEVTNKLAAKTIAELPDDIVKALSNKTNTDYLIVGLELKEEGLTPDEVKKMVRIYKQFKSELG